MKAFTVQKNGCGGLKNITIVGIILLFISIKDKCFDERIVKNMSKVYIIGASGLIGNALKNNLELKNYEIIATFTKNTEKDLIYFNLSDDNYSIFNKLDQKDVVLMSAYSNPNWISQNKDEAKNLNFTKTINLIKFLKSKSPKIIFMSSVEIFDGNKGNYEENDVPNPLNYYGLLKYEVEKFLLKEYPNHCVVRTGWNVGLNSKSRCVVQLTYETLLKEEAKMSTDNFFSLADVSDTAEGLSKLIINSELKKVHFCSDKFISRIELADLIINNSIYGDKMAYKRCLFKDIKYTEPRGKVNNLLNTLSKKKLNISYKETEQIVIDKVKFLDKK